jgi:hypothetical protein
VDVVGGRRAGGGAGQLVAAPGAGSLLVVALEGGGERVRRAVAGLFGDLGEGQVAGAQVVAGKVTGTPATGLADFARRAL